MGMGVVPFEGKVVEIEVEDRAHVGVEAHAGERAQLTTKLLTGLIEMVEIEMRIPEGQ